MALTFQVTLDARDPHELADWWASALGWTVELQDEKFIQEMIDAGHATEADTTRHQGRLVWKDGAAIAHPDGPSAAPRMYFQAVPEVKATKNRMHLDLRTGDEDAAAIVARLVESGATFLYDGRQGPHGWSTLSDPEGNEFCVSG
jgi:hypothetical protein